MGIWRGRWAHTADSGARACTAYAVHREVWALCRMCVGMSGVCLCLRGTDVIEEVSGLTKSM